MRKKIFKNMCLTAVFSVLLSSLLIAFAYYGDFQGRMESEVRSETDYLKSAVETAGADYLRQLEKTQNRLTLIDPQGNVLYDSYADETAMENHGGRPEVISALSAGAGEDTRMSDTIAKQTFYYAVRLSTGAVLRVAATTDTVFAALFGLLPWILGASAVAVLITALISHFLTGKIVAPINRLDLDNPEENAAYDELSPLLSKISRQNQVIAQQIRSLKEKQEEFAFLTEHMSEGFLVLDSNTDVLSYNTSALRLLGADPAPAIAHESALVLNRSSAFRTAVDEALGGARSQQYLRENGRCCQIMATPVLHDGKAAGAVVVILDVTEQEEREALRREFTANVSHELKTPLTSISGFAEIMQNGIAKAEDVPRFAGNIYREAQRLVSLVDDILNLSRLDEEETPVEWESFDISAIADEVAQRLAPAAKKQSVTITVRAKPACIYGVPTVAEEMIYNLCDNAIKYNRQNGSVTVDITQRPEGVLLSVADTGIGIAPADQPRVFERFYRVDKSHSKEIGGTGLGLSIVKHGAALLGAQISLESIEGQGTTVSVLFPPNKQEKAL